MDARTTYRRGKIIRRQRTTHIHNEMEVQTAELISQVLVPRSTVLFLETSNNKHGNIQK